MRLVVVVAAAFVLVAASLAESPLGDTAAPAARSRLIAFTRTDGLYVMRADGSGARRIMATGLPELPRGGAAWSPDGRRLAFASPDGIWLTDPDGGHRVRVLAAGITPYMIGAKPYRRLYAPRPTNFGSPTWSPDGRRIAFTAFEGFGNRDVFVIDADGSGLRRLKKTPFFEGEVDWSPAGGRLVFDSGSWVSDVLVMRADGTRIRNLTPGGGWVGAGQPSWSPDGQRIVFAQRRGIWVMGADGSSPARLTSSEGGDAAPDWSPDGRSIAFVRTLEAHDWSSAELYVVRPDGTGLTRLTHDRVAEGSPAWQPAAGS